jgi:shikimate kinase
MKLYPTVTDQALHFIVALAIGSAFMLGGVIGGAIAGLACGLIRELTEAGSTRIALSEIGPHFAKRDPWIDLAFWTMGGGVAGWLA